MDRAPLPAYHPRYMVPSSSAEAPDFELPPAQTPPPRVLRSETLSPPQDKFAFGGLGKEVQNGPPSPGPPENTLSRSPPPSPSPPHPPLGLAGMRLPALPPAPSGLVDAGIDAFDDDSDAEVGSDAFDGSSSSEFSWEGRARSVDAWLAPGRYEVLDRLLFAYIDPPVPVADVNAFLRGALATVEPLMPVEFLPTTRGAMLFRCEDQVARDTLRSYSPIFREGVQLSLQRPDECSNRFFRVPPWLAYVHVLDFPNEHWYEDKIKDAFRGFCDVVEIDPDCLTGDNFGPLRLLLEVNVRLEIPR